MVQKIYSKAHHVSWTNTHHGFRDLVNHGMAKTLECLEKGTKLFYETKKFLTCASDSTVWNVDVL